MRIAVIDYGVGNLGSIKRFLEELRVFPKLVNKVDQLSGHDALILPGVGNFAECASILFQDGWADAIKEEVKNGHPLLGICLGMQLLATYGTEGAEATERQKVAGLDLIPGTVMHLPRLGCNLRVPHVGWNSVDPVSTTSGLFSGIPPSTDFYFVHSYAFVAENQSDAVASAEYGTKITAAVQRGNVWGTQFHPEKSSRAGFKVLRNFIEAC